MNPRLEDLGHRLRAAAAADLANTRPSRGRVTRRRLAAGLVVAAVAVPGAAVAADALIGPDEVARSIPSGTLALLGTEPTCTTVRAEVEFACRLDREPSGIDVPRGRWKGTVEPTVDASSHFNGGCRSLNAAGTHWRCYVGREAVRKQVIGPALLGEPSHGPGMG